ncbi:SDR family oxidoreductase [Chitinophaga japonensis]|uniref:Short-subunit dehydrogenase n=1 Tax=Chitinophaga japonensis TaxID=104662 RepID=A0A562SSJ7_CHIJA|nr:SDR family oxidoreductase [Chitinophaga japonensis]TWI84225.1 short-subunit dehydrogenase [Chitinophaga japonensis]
MKKKVWFITGASKGLGLSLVKKLLQEGYAVAATSRNAKALEQAVGAASGTFLPLGMNLKDEQDVAKGIQAAVDHFGRIDVVVNNAGYGLAGALEELTDAEARENFEVNVFGALNVIRKVMPYLRAQQSGHILNVSSIAGFTGGFPGFGIYCATKFALTGLSESLAAEAQPFNIKVIIVSPGYFRTNFLETDSLNVPANPIADYVNVREAVATHQNGIRGNQPGDPDKAAAAMIEVVERPEAPLQLFLGQDAYNLAVQKIHAVQQDMSAVQALATATGFDN